jgi:hypothetical protein
MSKYMMTVKVHKISNSGYMVKMTRVTPHFYLCNEKIAKFCVKMHHFKIF